MGDDVKFGSAAMIGGQGTGQSGLFGMGESTIIARVTFILLDDSNKEKFEGKTRNVLCSGFGVGLSWGSAYLKLNSKTIFKHNYTNE